MYLPSLLTQGVFDLSKFMVGSDNESSKSNEERRPSLQTSRPTSVNESNEEAQTSRATSISPPPPAKPPRIYDTPEGEDDVVYNDPVDVQTVEKKVKEDEEELYESPVWSSSEIQSFAEEGRPAPRKSITVISTRSTMRNPTPNDYHYCHDPYSPYSSFS